VTTILVVLLLVALVLASEALRERRHDRHGVERRVVTYAGLHDSRISARLEAIRRRSSGSFLDRSIAGGQPSLGRRTPIQTPRTARA
jgi:hypothetical protein